jgi:endonuclease-3
MSFSFPIHEVMAVLRQAVEPYQKPLVDGMAEEHSSPFRVLVATILSLRTKDTMTTVVAERLFAEADTPNGVIAMGETRLSEVIYPVGFYRNKARTLIQVCTILREEYGGAVPDTLDALLALPGVGRKTANLVLTRGFGKLGICVDTHVHRICNRWGYLETKTPEKTEFALRERLPEEYWIPINGWLVTWGQHVCHPTSPRCSQCPLLKWCGQVGVTRHR